MLAPPPISLHTIVDQLRNEYCLPVAQLTFLPLGADSNTAVYRAERADGAAYFAKLRLGDFQVASLTVPCHLHEQGMRSIIPPIATPTGQLWVPLADYHLMLFPFVAGRPGYEQGLSIDHWHDFGVALRQLHTIHFPSALTRTIPREEFSPIWPARMNIVLQQCEDLAVDEPVVQALALFLEAKKAELLDLSAITEALAAPLRTAPPPFVLCHGDCHGWNLLIDEYDQLYLTDWDTVLFAPKERDLMFIGGGHGDSGYCAAEEETLFYQGYGQPPINRTALAYYRFARALEDIVLFAEQILGTDTDEERQQALCYLQSNFLPNSTIARAYQALAAA